MVATFKMDTSAAGFGNWDGSDLNGSTYGFPTWFTDLQLTASGASQSVNGVYTPANYIWMKLAISGTLDFTTELVGQSGFNGFFLQGGNPGVPTGADNNLLDVYNGQYVVLTSFAPALSPVPEPSEWAAISVGALGLAWLGKRRMTAKAS